MIPGTPILLAALFGFVVATTLGGALVAVLSTRLVRSVAGLAICAFGLAGLYVFLNSPFLALMEILIYVGAVCVTIVFGVMLSEPDEPARTGQRSSGFVWGVGALLVAAGIFWGTSILSLHGQWTTPAAHASDGSIRAIGISLLTTYSMAFELISLVLLVAILGALVIARSGRTKG